MANPAARRPHPGMASTLHPELRDALARASAALEKGRCGEAAGICDDLLRSASVPDAVKSEARKLREAAVGRLGKVARTIDLLEAATQAGPGNADLLGILSEVYRIAGRLDDALATATEVVGLRPGHSPALMALARIQADRCEEAAAAETFLAASLADPSNAGAHFGLAQMLLHLGEYRAGWAEYEWRHRLQAAKTVHPRLRLPQWNGMRLPNGHLALHTDQGYGDAFQFARFIPLVVERVGRVSLCCEPPCVKLFSGIPGLERVTADWAEMADAGFQTTLASLPGVFGATVDAIPGTVPYLSADLELAEKWRRTLDERIPAGHLRVGLSWAGNSAHSNDARRSVPFAACMPLAGLKTVGIVSLQKPIRPRDEVPFRSCTNIVDLGPELDDFAETAAVLANLDVVISVDSAVTHLAGALGRRVWVMLSQPSEWRWMGGRNDSPWYPSARLFRQASRGDWDGVVKSVAAALRNFETNS
jgi:tetratricopeptide (TPR) repeat protein